MRPEQKKAALRPFRRRIRVAFRRARLNASLPGKARNWFVPVLAEVLDVNYDLEAEIFGKRRLSDVVARDPRKRFSRLLQSAKRDSKTRSRWAAALANAAAAGIQREQLEKWLARRGGVAGRAREWAENLRSPEAREKCLGSHTNFDASRRHGSPAPDTENAYMTYDD